jgi:hypothetical protein
MHCRSKAIACQVQIAPLAGTHDLDVVRVIRLAFALSQNCYVLHNSVQRHIHHADSGVPCTRHMLMVRVRGPERHVLSATC